MIRPFVLRSVPRPVAVIGCLRLSIRTRPVKLDAQTVHHGQRQPPGDGRGPRVMRERTRIFVHA